MLHADGSVEVARRRPRHPGRRRAQDRADRRRGRHDQAARRRQVRRRLLHRLRRPARRRRVGGQRALRPARRRGRPGRHGRTRCRFRRGVPGVFAGRRAGAAGVHREPGGLRAAGKVARKGVTGTRVRCWADRQVFLKDAGYTLDDLHDRARQTSFLVPGLTIVVRDERGPARAVERAGVPPLTAGSRSSASSWPRTRAVTDVLRLHRRRAASPRPCRCSTSSGHMTPTEVERELQRRRGAALGHRLRHGRPLVRQHHRHPEGRHPRGRVRAGPAKTVNEQLRASRRAQGRRGRRGSRTTCSRGSPRWSRCGWPSRSSRARPRRCSAPPAARASCTKVVERGAEGVPHLDAGATTSSPGRARCWRRSPRRRGPGSPPGSTRSTQRRKNALETSSLPAKLADCRSDDVDRSELFIVEGDSALGTAKLARDSEFQALLPIRGKILNVQKASPADMLKNAECAAIIQVIGAGLGAHLRPGRGPVRQGHLHDRRRRRRRAHPHPAAHPVLPLHAPAARGRAGLRRRAAAAPGRGDQRRQQGKNEYVYTYSDAELHQRAGRAGRKRGHAVEGRRSSATRASARWTPTSWPRRRWTPGTHPAPDHPRRRRGRRAVFELLMGNDVAPRREFIVDGRRRARPRPASTPERAAGCAPSGQTDTGGSASGSAAARAGTRTSSAWSLRTRWGAPERSSGRRWPR